MTKLMNWFKPQKIQIKEIIINKYEQTKGNYKY